MDSLTQIVLGASVGEAVLGKRVGNKAMAWGAIAGTIPDLDVFIRFFTDQVTATELHRGLSHSLIFCIVAAPILGWLVNKFHRKLDIGWKPWAWLFFWGLVTHPLLDAHTTWGTQFFWPFDLRLAYKTIFVVDPLYTVPFLICTLIALFMKRDNPKRYKINKLGLIISSSYLMLSVLLKGISYSYFKEQLKTQKIDYEDLDVRPMPLNTIVWNAQIKTDSTIYMGYYSFFDTQPVQFSSPYSKNDHLLAPYEQQRVIHQLRHITEGWYFVEEDGNGLIFTDVRFGQMGVDPDKSPFLFRYRLTPDENGVLTAEQLPRSADADMGKAFGDLWERIKGN